MTMTTTYCGEQIIAQDDNYRILRAQRGHPGIDSGTDLARESGGDLLGQIEHVRGATGCDFTGGPPLVLAVQNIDDSIGLMYWYGYDRANVLGWHTYE
jgi:hypothetical protein